MSRMPGKNHSVMQGRPLAERAAHGEAVYPQHQIVINVFEDGTGAINSGSMTHLATAQVLTQMANLMLVEAQKQQMQAAPEIEIPGEQIQAALLSETPSGKYS